MSKKFLLFLLTSLLFLSILFNFFLLYDKLERTRVSKVIDGDSLELKDGRRIRLLSIDAPEIGRCFADQARIRLQQLIKGKRIKLENSVTDDYGRILANIYLGNTLINLLMLEEGLARFVYTSNPYYKEMLEATRRAKENKLGIWSPACRTSSYLSPNPSTLYPNPYPLTPSPCLIKGNNKGGQKIYHLPNCRSYKLVIVDESFGDQWFCSQSQAQAAGFRKAKECE